MGIIIPNHNYDKWVASAIQSVVNDPYSDKRICVIDDGSSDNSWPIICKNLGIKDVRQETLLTGNLQGIPTYAFRYAKAGGPSRARNTGIKILWDQVNIFGFLDSDDEYRPGKIAKSVKKILSDPINIGAVYTDFDTINETNGQLTRNFKEPFSRNRLLQECIVNNDSIVNKRAFELCGLYDEEMRVCEDYDLWVRMSEKSCLIHIPEPLLLIRVGKHGSTDNVSKEIWNRNWQRIRDKMQERING